jgi:BNR repeat protein
MSALRPFRRRHALRGVVVLACAAGGGLAAAAFEGLSPSLVSGPTPFANCVSAPSFEGAEVEPALASDPDHTNRLVAVYQQDRYHGGGARGIVTATSTDGGRTWGRTALPLTACAGPRARQVPFASDPWVSVGPDGRIYAATLSDVVSVLTSADWGRSWSGPSLLRGRYGLTDKETVTADPRRPGTAYVVWSDYRHTNPPGTESDELVATTRDGGRHWTQPKIVVRHGHQAGPEDGQILVDPRTGRLYLLTVWIRDAAATPSKPAWMLVSRSHDGGAHWTTAHRFGIGTPAAHRDGPVIRSSPQIPSFAIDGRGALYAVWQDARFSSGAREDILLARSSDGGLHWSTPRRISTPSTGGAIIPTIAARGTGSLAVIYLQLERSDGTVDARYRIAGSRDGGRHFTDRAVSATFSVTDAPNVTPSPLVPGGYFVGDYMGIAPLSTRGFGAVFVVAKPGTVDKTDVFYVARP